MKIKKLISGLSAFAIAASAMAVNASAADEPVENNFYNAAGKWVITYSGANIAKDKMAVAVDPAGDDTSWNEGSKSQLVGYTDPETEKVETYNFGCNIQVGHTKNSIVTVKVTSTKDNIFDGEKGVNEGYMYTVQKSWSGDAAADFQEGWVKYQYDDEGNKVMANGATDLNGWKSGSTKFNGNWAQITLTDDDVSALTFEVTLEADSKTKWEYHPYNAEKPEEYQYVLFNFGGNGCFNADSIKGDGDCAAVANTAEDGSTVYTTVVDGDYINSQFGGKTKPAEPAYISIKKAKVTFKSNTVAYTGKALKPAVTVKLAGDTLKKGTDYTVSYKNNKKTGKATAVVTGKGGYIDSVSKSFIIVPKKPAKPTVKAGSKKMTVTLKKDKTATGYQISYSLKKNFKSGVKNVNITKNSTVKKTISKLKKGKTYYVKSRSYIKVGSKKYYGAYGAVSSAKIK